MKSTVALVVGLGIGLLTAGAPGPARLVHLVAAQATPGTAAKADAAAPAQQPGMRGNMMMGNITAADAKLDELVKKMNDAKGQAKIDAMAEVVTTLVQQHKSMRGMMAGRMGMMNGMPNVPAGQTTAPAQPEK